MPKLLIQCLFFVVWFVSLDCQNNLDRPKIITQNGDIIIQSAFNKKIVLRPNGPNSAILAGDVNLLERKTSENGEQYLAPANNNFEKYFTGPNSILNRLETLENKTTQPATTGYFSSGYLSRRVNRLFTRVSELQRRIDEMVINHCSSNPCQKGGTCLQLVNGYHCLCPSNWEGKNCDVDVNECRNFAGTDLGCQNGATCINKPGTYECACNSGWFGLHCTKRERDCSQGNSEMCGHGTCIPTKGGKGFTCLCDQGWETNGTGVECLTDINECDARNGPRCSVNPKVECVNWPGSFRCGQCPAGYEGDGFTCSDINECLTMPNGGCSPLVTCHNTVGSRICGPCPQGYQGDGLTCTWKGSCNINHGGCHPSAQCVENMSIVQCVCPYGMDGDGIGIHGCYISSYDNSSKHCEDNPCGAHGQCHQLISGYTCLCYKGYSGAHCEVASDVCSGNPCKNGGTCRADSLSGTSGFRCECTAQYTGNLCEMKAMTCGGYLDSEEGSIVYPLTNTSYKDNTKCAWVIHTIPSKVINVTFSKFNLEPEPECLYDFLQIHDGRTSSSQLIGRFCGNEFPKGGKIISSHNYLYLWFRSDDTRAGSGFALHWNSIDPVCGGELNATTHGQITSPGSPGKYPPNRDCYWFLSTLPSKRISLSFFTLDIESHANCSFDFLAIYNGRRNTDPLINKYCNSTQPQPVTSTSSDIMIHFHSDSHGSGHGFQIAFASVEGIPGCGGLYTLDKGEIVSPSYNGKYLDNLRCEYKISVAPESKIRFEFKSFDLEVSPRCRYDYVKVYDGPSTESKLIGKFCGRTMYPKTAVISSSNNLVIIFRTDRNMNYGGFKLVFDTVCQKTLHGDSGIITSPGYPFAYPPNKDCEYLISTVPGKAIQLTFQDFNIEDSIYYNCRYDFVEVRDGPDQNSTLLGKFCGLARFPPTQTSTHNVLYVRFKSDLSNPARTAYKGFYANYTTIDTECGGIYRETTGIINHPSSGTTYKRNQECSWLLVAPEGMHIKLSWNSFDLEANPTCISDYLEIIEIDITNTNETLGKYCGSKFPPAVTTSTNRILMKFKSDYNQQSSGFSVVYTFLDTSRSCGGTYVKSHGFIYSPGWPKRYEPNRVCTWTIQVPIGQQIVLNISRFNLEQPYHNKCEMGDYLEIRNGLTQAAALIGKYCGTMNSKRIASMTNALYLHFHSDFYITGDGFQIEWTSIATRCGGTLTSSSGSITSPNYPEKYNDNEECFYKIITNQGSRIRISFSVLDLENTISCKDDYVEIFDGKDENSPSLGKHCIMNTELTNIQTSSNVAFIKFRSDFYISSKGFSLNYDTICQNNITGTYGVIESPDYPSNYPLNSNCLWTINVPLGHKINVTFTHFDLYSPHAHPWGWRTTTHDNCMDYVQFKETKQLEFSRKYCGLNKPRIATTSSNSLQLKFVSGNFFPKTGFRVEWVSVGCGGRIVKRFGSLNLDKSATSDGEMECQWIIEAPLGKKITIQFENVYMSGSPNCTVDAIELFNGQNMKAPVISKFCHDFQGTHRFQSTSNFMLVRLIKHSNLKDVHFTSSFTTYDSGCGGAMQSRTGMIYSPNYPNNYDNDLNCLWTITVPQYHRIELNFLDFDLYNTDDKLSCSDYIQIFDTNRIQTTNYTEKICPKRQMPIQVISKSNFMSFQFISDNYGAAKGFKANFSIICGATIIATHDGVITDDKYLSHSNLSCKWTIKAPRLDQKITLTITHMDIPKTITNATLKSCPSTFLRVLGGDDENAPLINEYCGSYTPTIVSTGSALTIELGTYGDRIQGHFSAHYTALDNACGGTLTSESGEIASPNYPSPYPPDSDCEWTLATSPGNKVYINFESFDLESSEGCYQDYVEVRENDGGGRLLGLYCGNTIPINTTAASKLYVKFRSDDLGSSKGFVIKYGFLHGNDITGLNSGEVASPLYPQSYGGSGQYTWRITVLTGDTISLSITRLEIHTQGQACTNTLNIYDGYDEDAPLLENICGVLRNNEKTLRTSSNVVFIQLSLDELNSGSLFHIRWTRTTGGTDTATGQKINCGSKKTTLVLPGNDTIIHSPNFPDGYNDNSNCEWIFKTLPGRHLELDFTTFHLEERSNCYADYVSVYSSDTPTEWNPLKTNTCTKTAIADIKASMYLKINFVTDSSMTDKGFEGRINSKCGGIFTDSSSIVRPSWFDWNDGYGSLQCDWKIKVRPGRQISIRFLTFNITNEKDCSTFLILRNGESSESPLLSSGKYCGYDHEVKEDLVTSGNTLFISYVAKRQPRRKYKTFAIWYEEKNIECGTTSTLSTEHNWELINSPNYPSVPVPYSECVWVFTGPPGEILRIDFIDRFDIDSRNSDCSTEYVELRDGSSEFSPLLGRFCTEKPGTIKTTNNLLYVKYSTQISEPRNGFRANVSIDVCGGTIMAAEGELSSPGYPHMAPLPYGTVCVWRIIGDSGHTFLFRARDINLPDSESPCATKITVEESIPENNTVTVLKSFCGDRILDPSNQFIESLTNNVTIKLHIGKPASYSHAALVRGFRFTFNSSMPLCSGTITTSEGYLTTPSYPRETSIRFCHWKITAPDVNRRISLELMDFDPQGQRIGIYSINDRSHVAIIQNIPSSDYVPTQKTFESTGNSLILYVWLDASSGSTHRFKAKFDSDKPALCGGNLQGSSGSLLSPNIDKPYTCKWRYNTGNMNSTNTIVMKLMLNSSVNSFRCRRMDPNLSIFYHVDDDVSITNTIGQCANTETVHRIPSNGFELTATKNKHDSMFFNTEWYTRPCGGHVIASQDPVNILNIPSNFNDTLDCAWVITSPFRNRVEIKLEGSFQYDCNDEFIKIYPQNGRSSIVIGEYCKDKLQDSPLLAAHSRILVEYHAKPRNNSNIKLMARLAQNQCGRLMTNEDTFSSPNYPKHYTDNQECAWEIKTDLGSRVSIQFTGRFAIEGQPGSCNEDAVIIYDWKDDAYAEVARLCGRELPPSYNSTFNQMKIIFRTNDKTNLDGFEAHWTRICGGQYIASETEQFLYSPGYPYSYRPFMNCKYTITSPTDRSIFIKFIDFELEGPYPECGNDNLTITSDSDYEYFYGLYCGSELPEMLNHKSFALTLLTDSFIYRRGFKLAYWITSCGGEIKEPTIISSSPMDSYDTDLNCTWTIKAPHDKIVVLHFIDFDLEHTYSCYNDYLAVYDGLTIDSDKRLALMCGYHDNSSNIVIKSNNNTMLMNFITDSTLSGKGFKVSVLFSYSSSVGCGGHINLTSSTTLKSPSVGSQGGYDFYLHCIWTIVAPIDHVIKMSFTSFHIAPCQDVNQTEIGINECDCDYVLLRDGIEARSTIINKYCGHTLPMEVITSGNTLSVILHTDGEINSSGFEATLQLENSACGQSHYIIDNKKTVIRSPGYPGSVPRGIRCKYYLQESDSDYYSTTYVHVKYLDLPVDASNASKCSEDKLIISTLEKPENETVGSEYIMSRDTSLFFDSAYLYEESEETLLPKTIVLCGNQKSLDFYLTGSIQLRLQTSPPSDTSRSDHKGFEIEISHSDYCTKNYTVPYGRVKTVGQSYYEHDNARGDCYTLITVPENYTVSAYFISVSPTYWHDEMYFEIHDGNTTSAKSLRKIGVDYTDTLTAFSTGRYMLLHNHVGEYGFISYDMVYMSSQRIPGCGGKLVNELGKLTSPMYPDIFRQKATCEWELETPPHTRLHLRFSKFDLSAVCDQVYLKLVDRKGDDISQYCEEAPADYTSPDNYVKIVFVSTRNNGGQGFVAEFIGIV